MTSETTTRSGAYGVAYRGPVDGVPEFAQTVVHWLIEAPGQHPLWTQYVLAVVRLQDDVPGFPPPIRHFAGTTHEMFLMALDPDRPVVPGDLTRPDYRLPILTPVNFAHQFIATDREMEQLAELSVASIVNGINPAEPLLGYGSFREGWLVSLTKTLAHIRGEEHAR